MDEPVDNENLKHNREAWNRMVASKHALTRVARDEEFQNPLKVVDASGWLPGGINGWNVLCLAAGGGRHGPLYAACGANVTVVDLSPAMLEHDRIVAEARKLTLRTIEASMDNLSMLRDEEFDLVIHPVSTCYLPRVDRVFQEVARVTRSGGIYISQHKQPANLQASLETYTGQYRIEHAYYDSSPVASPTTPTRLREPNTREYIHRWATLLGGICRSGFHIEDVSEPNHGKPDSVPGSFAHRCYHIAPYLRIKARRQGIQARKLLIT